MLITLLPSIITASVAVLGFYVFHRLALIRQFRTEINDHLDGIREKLAECISLSDKAWLTAGGAEKFQENERAAKYAVQELGQMLTALQLRDERFTLPMEMVHFRRACTDGVDDRSRPADPGRLGVINLEANKMRQALNDAWSNAFPAISTVVPRRKKKSHRKTLV